MEGILILSSFSISKSDCVLTSVLSGSSKVFLTATLSPSRMEKSASNAVECSSLSLQLDVSSATPHFLSAPLWVNYDTVDLWYDTVLMQWLRSDQDEVCKLCEMQVFCGP